VAEYEGPASAMLLKVKLKFVMPKVRHCVRLFQSPSSTHVDPKLSSSPLGQLSVSHAPTSCSVDSGPLWSAAACCRRLKWAARGLRFGQRILTASKLANPRISGKAEASICTPQIGCSPLSAYSARFAYNL